MFEPLFPGWSSPAAIAGFVALIAVSNAALVALVTTAPWSGRRRTAPAAAVAVASVAAAVSVLHGGLGAVGGTVELLARLALILAAGGAVVSRPTAARLAAGVVTVGSALVLLAVTVPLYGEATVAP